mmetsp:Transcript_27958/g.80087  ORF Transcript_27958/g.80087 Transcript_27958/m.80087 type:complete len:480 (-) Transcript_27958:464-1903(-)
MAQIEVLQPSDCIGTVDAREVVKQSTEPPPEANPETGAPTALRSFIVRHDPKMLLVPGFLTEMECEHLRQLAEGHFTRSLVGTKDTADGGDASGAPGRASVNGVYAKTAQTRTSTSCMLRPAQSGIVERIEHRVAALAGLPVEQLERLVVVRYAPGEHFNEHHDGKFRPRTVFVYLNELPEGDGGDTFFPHLGLSFVPRAGCAVMWPNARPDGKEDSRMVHAGRAPKTAVKYGFNCFFNDSVVRLMDYPTIDLAEQDAFVVDFRALGAGRPAPPDAGGAIHTFSFDTEPKVTGVPGFATEAEIEHLFELSGNGSADAAASPGKFRPCLRSLETPLHLIETASTPAIANLEARLAAVARFPLEHLAPLRVVRCSLKRGFSNRGCGQRAGFLCLSEAGEVFFPHLGLRCQMSRGDLLIWSNAVRAQTVDSDAYGGEGASRTGHQRVVEDMRTLRVHLPVGDATPFGVDISFADAPVRTPGS